MVCRNLCHVHLKEVGLTQIPAYYDSQRIVIGRHNVFVQDDLFTNMIKVHLLNHPQLQVFRVC